MAINKKLIHFKNKEKFEEELAKGNILETSIVFILDTTEIYTHGLLYDGSTFDSSDIEASILNIIDNYATKTEIPTKVSQLENDANYTSSDNLKTINGESIIGEGNIELDTTIADKSITKEKLSLDILDLLDQLNAVLVDAEEEADDPIVSEYITSTQLENKLLNKQDKLVSGSNIKTINGTSILGSGDIVIEGGSSNGGAYAEVNHGTDDTVFTLTPNTFHVWDEVSALTLTFGSETAGVANEFLFQFTSGSEPTTLTMSDDIKWTEELIIEPNMIYQVSILKGLASVLSWENAPDLIENHITYNEGNFMNGGTITFEYPTASELTFTMNYYSSRELLIPQGTTNMTIDWFEPQPPQIINIYPTNDSIYKYNFA